MEKENKQQSEHLSLVEIAKTAVVTFLVTFVLFNFILANIFFISYIVS